MIKIGPKYLKLKTDLQLSRHRLQTLKKKKKELSQKLQKEIANHLDKGKFMPAKIKVQTVIRYEEAQEAMEIIEMMCEQILERYSLFEETKELDQSLEQAVSSLIWVSPYMRSEIVELKDIFKQLSVKYGSDYAKSALKNKQLTVNPELIERVKLNIPSEDKIQKYLRCIASKHSVPNDRRIEMEVYFSKSDSSESKRISQNIDLVESKRFSPASNDSVSMEDVKDSETFEGHGTSVHDASVTCKKVFSNLKFVKNRRPKIRWTRNFFRKNTLPDIPEENEDVETENSLHDQDHSTIQKINGNDDDSVNKGDAISGSVLGRHHMFGTFNENSKNISDSKNNEVPTATEIRSNFLLSAYKKKGNLRGKVPTIYENDSGFYFLEDEKQNISKKTEYNDLIPGKTPVNDFDNDPAYTDCDRPPSYEAVVCNRTEDNSDVSHPYQFEVDIKMERFPQYPTLPTCPTLDDMSEENEDVETENSLHDQDHSSIQKINGNDDDSVNKGDAISSTVSGRHRMLGTFIENSKNILDSKNKKVPTATEMRSNFLLSTYKKKGNLRVKVPTIYENDSGFYSLEDEKQNISKKTEYNDLIPGNTPMKDFQNDPAHNDFDRPPSYEAVVCNRTENNLDVSHPYRFEVDIKLERFPQYSTLPRCPTLDDMSEKRFDNAGSSHIGGDSEKDGKTYSDRKNTPA